MDATSEPRAGGRGYSPAPICVLPLPSSTSANLTLLPEDVLPCRVSAGSPPADCCALCPRRARSLATEGLRRTPQSPAARAARWMAGYGRSPSGRACQRDARENDDERNCDAMTVEHRARTRAQGWSAACDSPSCAVDAQPG